MIDGSSAGPGRTVQPPWQSGTVPAFWQQFLAWMAQSPAFAQLVARTMGDQATLWKEWIERAYGVVPGDTGPSPATDARQRDAFFMFLRDAHALNERFLQTAADLAEMDNKAKGQLSFFFANTPTP